MSLWSKVHGFFQRHKNKFIIGGIVISGSILLTKYAQQKLREWQEQQAKEFLERTRKQQHFESTERTCNRTILSLLNSLMESLNKVIDTDLLLEEIRRNPENKVKLWEDLKIKVFAKITCFIYTLVILIVTLRVQLSVLGGYMFKDPKSVNADVQEKYLMLSHNLLDSGIRKLSSFFEQEYLKILGPVSLKKSVKLVDLEKIFWEIQTATKSSLLDPIEHIQQYVISEDKQHNPVIYESLIQDTVDILESDEVKSLANSCISRAFILLGDKILEFYGPTKSTSGKGVDKDTNFVHPSHIEVALAKIIPIISGLMTRNSYPESLVQQLINNDKLKVLSANIYEAFSGIN